MRHSQKSIQFAAFFNANAKRFELQATEVIRLTNMHLLPKPRGARAAAERVSFLNKLSASDLGATKAMEFRVRADDSVVVVGAVQV